MNISDKIYAWVLFVTTLIVVVHLAEGLQEQNKIIIEFVKEYKNVK